MTVRRKILVIMSLRGWFYDGNCLRIKNIFSRLSARHDVILLYVDDFNCPGALEAVRPYFKKAFYMDRKPAESLSGRLIKLFKLEPEFMIRDSDRALYGKIRAKVESIIKEEGIEIVHVWGIRNGQFLENVRNVAILHDLCDSFALTYKDEFLAQGFSPKASVSFLRAMRYEKGLIKKSFTCVVSARDKNLIGAAKNDRCFVAPNGVDANHFSPMPREKEGEHSFAFSGDMSFGPNIKAARYFYKEVFPIVVKKYPGARWYVIGREPAEEISKMHDGKNIIVTGFVDRIIDHLGKANVFIAPMVSGLGIKNKILEAMAMGKPVLSTRLGMAGIEYEEGRHVLTADTPGEFADKLIQLLGDGELRKQLGEGARQLVVEKYSWENTVAKYEEIYNKMSHYKVMYVVHSLGTGGTEKLVCQMAESLKDSHSEAIICCLDYVGAWGEEMKRRGIKVFNVERRPGVDLGIVKKLRAIIREERPDILHAHQYTPYFYSVLSAALSSPRPKLIFTEHGRHYPDKVRPKRTIFNQCANIFTDAIFGVSEFTKRSLIKYEKFPEQKIRVIYNGIKQEEFQGKIDVDQKKRALGLKADVKIIGTVGRMCPVKNFGMLIRAFGGVKKEIINVKLLIAGDGELKEELVALAVNLGLKDDVVFLSKREDAPELMKIFDVFALSSDLEGAALVLLEAMASGVPVVATAVGGTPELVADGLTGILTPRGDHIKFSEAVLSILRNPEIQKHMREAGKRRVEEKFTFNKMRGAYMEAYQNCLRE